jgi:hypothetical protein
MGAWVYTGRNLAIQIQIPPDKWARWAGGARSQRLTAGGEGQVDA